MANSSFVASSVSNSIHKQFHRVQHIEDLFWVRPAELALTLEPVVLFAFDDLSSPTVIAVAVDGLPLETSVFDGGDAFASDGCEDPLAAAASFRLPRLPLPLALATDPRFAPATFCWSSNASSPLTLPARKAPDKDTLQSMRTYS